ncbi:PleD family two-component system response regulator [Anaplasma bovis]|uniref:PleD family two-component system response regulator n=1 Tax=Anaplasma bovis TaxID=186733 RepID=UPI002FF0C2CD
MTARILVVDDLEDNLKLLQAKLTSEYYSVLTANNGPDAIKIAQESKPDLVLLDVMMPGMDGFEVCRKLRADPSITYIPVVMVTALDNTSENRVNGLNAGADDFLTKPINDMALFSRIRSLTKFKLLVDELRLRGKTSADMQAVDCSIMQYSNQISDGTIIIADEDKIRSEVVNNTLQKHFKDTVVITPTQVIDFANVRDCDLFIVDLHFSGDGLRLCSNLRSNADTRYTPVLLLPDESDDTEILSRAFEIGINDYVMAPMCKNELIARTALQIKRKRYQDALRMHLKTNAEMSIKDSLTGCYNRRYFDMYFQNIVTESQKTNKDLSLVILDIDSFKQVNDTYGHPIGDELLQLLCRRIFDNIRVSDLLARFGGEEFVIIFPETPMAEAIVASERLRELIECEPFVTNAVTLKKTVSMGVTGLQSDDTPPQMLARADKFLYVAKKTKNSVISDANC